MIARTESFVACSTEMPGAEAMTAPLAGSFAVSDLARIFSPIAFSTVAQLPSSAETISPLAWIGQFGRSQEAPAAFFSASPLSSFRDLKNVCHSGSTEFGSRA